MKMRGGWEVRPSFSVSQNADRGEVLQDFLAYFGCGTIRPDRSDKTIKYEVRSIADLMGNVVPHFEAYPMRSSKQKDFEQFAIVCRLVAAGAHLTESGFREIADRAVTMNSSGRRKYAISELLDRSEPKVIVSASSNGG
jgi:hypothetical protein